MTNYNYTYETTCSVIGAKITTVSVRYTVVGLSMFIFVPPIDFTATSTSNLRVVVPTSASQADQIGYYTGSHYSFGSAKNFSNLLTCISIGSPVIGVLLSSFNSNNNHDTSNYSTGNRYIAYFLVFTIQLLS